MPSAQQIQRALEQVRDRASFLQTFLAETLDWPIEQGVEDPEPISYAWSEDELRTQGLDQHLVEAQVRQFRPFHSGQPWGIFLLEFHAPHHFDTTHSLTGATGTLRKVLRGLVPSRRHDPSLAAWQREHLLFLCTHDYRSFRFAYFKAPLEPKRAAPLAAFGWNQGETHVRTLCEFNLPPLAFPEDEGADGAGWVARWAAAFDVEAVTKKFFAEYRAVFEKVEDGITGVPKGEPRRLYTQRLFNRLMFLYFNQRKGWLAFEGDRNYLRALFRAAQAAGEDFLNERLYWTFFYGLNTAAEDFATHSDVKLRERRGDVPFLNGGLFDLEDEYDTRDAVKIPNAAFAAVFDLLDRYNFTVTESTPLDIEVAVDPEMLGSVFEELVTGRHETGSHYTPRPIVAFMCREALKHYLAATVSDETAVARFVDEGDPSRLPDPELVLNALRAVKVCDPACGSGAYLLGMMQELLRLREALFATRGLDAVTVYRRKLEIIEKNLHGVDIDLFAVNIAKLRLWLSLAVDFVGTKPPPLPNLDFKIECGDSLTAPNPQELSDLFRHALVGQADELADLKGQFIQTYGRKKRQLAGKIEKQEAELRAKLPDHSPDGSVDWRVAFAEVFKNGGFDIALANPPYVRQELIKDIKPALKTIYPAVYSGTADLYCFFYARALQLLRPGGMLAFISSNKWFRAAYGAKLRNHIATTCNVRSITDFGELPVFQSAATFPMIFIARKGKPGGSLLFTQVKSVDPPYPDVLALVQRNGEQLPADALRGAEWTLTGAAIADRLRKMEKAGVRLGEYVGGQIFNGVKTGLNQAFVVDGATKARLIREDRSSARFLFPYLDGDNVRRYNARETDAWLLYIRWTDQLPRSHPIMNHLSRFRSQLAERDGARDGGPCPWFALSRPRPESFELFRRPKIVFPDIAKESRFTLDRTGAFINNTTYFIPGEDLYLLGVLNSAVMWSYCKERLTVIGDSDRGGRLRFFRQFVELLPIPEGGSASCGPIIALVQNCLGNKGADCRAWEKEIDERVAALYGL